MPNTSVYDISTSRPVPRNPVNDWFINWFRPVKFLPDGAPVPVLLKEGICDVVLLVEVSWNVAKV